MYKLIVVVGILFFVSGTYASAATSDVSCLEDDRGYQLIRADGTIDPVRFYGLAVKKISASSLSGRTIPELQQFGVTTGDPREWARLLTMLCRQESGCRIARVYPDGSLEKFPGTLPGERSYGPLQFNIGEYGLTSWAMVNSPSCTLDAVIRVVERNGSLSAYFGPIRRPQEVLRHASWFNSTVQPFADALRLVFDPNAPNYAATYRAVAPYFVDSASLGLGTSLGGNSLLGNPYGSSLGAYSSQGASASTMASASQGGAPTGGVASGGQTTIGSGTPQSALLIFPQPAHVVAGGSVLLSWTSAGVQAGSCAVTSASGTVATTEAGSQRVSVPGSSGSTTTFTLTCTTLRGERVAPQAQVRVD